MKILIIVNRAEFLLSHRYEICLALLRNGAEVHVACPPNSVVVSQFRSDGIHHHPIEFYANSLLPHKLFLSIFEISKVVKLIKPDLVHSIAMKPVLCGGIASRLCGVPAVVSSVAGLGLMYSSPKLNYRFLRKCLTPFLAFCFRHQNHVVVLQNDNDRETLVNSEILLKRDSVMIRGSGVDLDRFSYVPEPVGTPVVLFASRLLKDKGLIDLVQAIKILRSQNVELRLLVAGLPDPFSPNSLSEEVLDDWSQAGLVERLGFCDDMPTLLKQANIFCFPSFYGEGVPKVILEAAASGRSVVTTNHPGCRDAVSRNTGLLVPIKNPQALAMSLLRLLEDDELRLEMGQNARVLAERSFSVDTVVKKHIDIYQSLACK